MSARTALVVTIKGREPLGDSRESSIGSERGGTEPSSSNSTQKGSERKEDKKRNNLEKRNIQRVIHIHMTSDRIISPISLKHLGIP